VDTLSTMPYDPPSDGADLALDPDLAGGAAELLLDGVAVLAAAELPPELALTIPKAPPATATPATPTTMDVVSLREYIS
jgi:hypothetical protein